MYFYNTYQMPQESLANTVEYYFPHDDASLSARTVNKATLALNETSMGRPLGEYLLGIAMVFKRVDGGNGAYFMQKVSSSAFRAYFPTVFAIKEPLPNLFLMLLALLVGFFLIARSVVRKISFHFDSESETGASGNLAEFIRHNIVGLSLFAFVFLYAYISVTGNLNIGFRHLFPILPFAYILTAIGIFGFLKRISPHAKQIWGSFHYHFAPFPGGRNAKGLPGLHVIFQ